MSFLKEKKYIWLPSLIAIYAFIMAWWNRSELDTPSGAKRFWIIVVVETVILILAAIFLKKRARINRK
ncbi:MAG: hypothetical protein NC201_05435 [Prevotella sp.]|nr:hypothetical protein [Bacteroides sp.]MCM1366675.1 hypothetical protein [Prevotella sp.]